MTNNKSFKELRKDEKKLIRKSKLHQWLINFDTILTIVIILAAISAGITMSFMGLSLLYTFGVAGITTASSVGLNRLSKYHERRLDAIESKLKNVDTGIRGVKDNNPKEETARREVVVDMNAKNIFSNPQIADLVSKQQELSGGNRNKFEFNPLNQNVEFPKDDNSIPEYLQTQRGK